MGKTIQLSCIMNGVGTPEIVSVESRESLEVICDAVFWFWGLLWALASSFLLGRFCSWLPSFASCCFRGDVFCFLSLVGLFLL